MPIPNEFHRGLLSPVEGCVERVMNTWAPAAMDSDREQPAQRIIDHEASSSERTYALMTHLSPLFGYFALVGHIPGLSILFPLILWQVRKKDSPFLDDHGREAVNFQISVGILGLAAWSLVLCGIGFVLVPPLFVFSVTCVVMAALAARRGEFYRYPCCIRLLG